VILYRSFSITVCDSDDACFDGCWAEGVGFYADVIAGCSLGAAVAGVDGAPG
jgi:hypothetical protein